jgi:molybdate transport system ATP-binding protein
MRMVGLNADFTVRYPGGVEVSATLALEAEDPFTICLFGPSGSGKTTILRALAGLVVPQSGHIRFGREVWFDSSRRISVHPHRRGVGFVHQRPTLFPHLSVLANVAYAARDARRRERIERAQEALRLVGAEHLSGRRPSSLSGGEAQLVSIARALCARTKLLLLDEPLSSVDQARRPHMRKRLREIVAERGLPAILVTHDIDEAVEFGEYLAVVMEGKLVQFGRSNEVVAKPANPRVAEVVGVENLVPGTVRRVSGGLVEMESPAGLLLGVADQESVAELLPAGQKAYACIRAANIAISKEATSGQSPRNRLSCVVTEVIPKQGLLQVELDCGKGIKLRALVTPDAAAEVGIAVGARLTAFCKAVSTRVIPAA